MPCQERTAVDRFTSRLHVPLCDTMHCARNVKSAAVCEGKRVVARLRLPRIVELCNRHAEAAERGEYLLMVRMIPPAQQVSLLWWTTRLNMDVCGSDMFYYCSYNRRRIYGSSHKGDTSFFRESVSRENQRRYDDGSNDSNTIILLWVAVLIGYGLNHISVWRSSLPVALSFLKAELRQSFRKLRSSLDFVAVNISNDL